MRKLLVILAVLLSVSCQQDIPISRVIFISVAASYGSEGEINYLANPPDDQRALSEQLEYLAMRRGMKYTEYLFLECDGRQSISGDERYWGRKNILQLLKTLEAEDDDLIIFHYAGHGDSNGSFVMPDGTRLNPDEVLMHLRSAPGMKCAFIDSCYSGRFIKPSKTMADGEVFRDGKLISESFVNALLPSLRLFFTISEPDVSNTWILTAATSDQLSYDSWDDGRDRQDEFGAFTYFLLLALGYSMEDGTPGLPLGRLTFYSVYSEIKDRMSQTLWRQATPQATLSPVDLVLF